MSSPAQEVDASPPSPLGTPSSFLQTVVGNRVLVRLNSGVSYHGILNCLDGYMNIALENTEEWVQGKKTNEFGDAFVRGNNGTFTASSFCSSFGSRMCAVRCAMCNVQCAMCNVQVLIGLGWCGCSTVYFKDGLSGANQGRASIRTSDGDEVDDDDDVLQHSRPDSKYCIDEEDVG